jgi:hypothetical protein
LSGRAAEHGGAWEEAHAPISVSRGEYPNCSSAARDETIFGSDETHKKQTNTREKQCCTQ